MPRLLFPGEVGDVRLGPEVLEQPRAAGRSEQPRDLALGVLEVTEDEGLRLARLRARRVDLAVLQLALFRLRLDLPAPDPLDAEGALLHDADFAQRDVRVELKVERLVPRRVEEVEEPHVVRE